MGVRWKADTIRINKKTLDMVRELADQAETTMTAMVGNGGSVSMAAARFGRNSMLGTLP